MKNACEIVPTMRQRLFFSFVTIVACLVKKVRVVQIRRNRAWIAALALLSALALSARADSDDKETEEDADSVVEEAESGAMEELTVTGRYRAAAIDVISERIESDVPVDMVDAEFISRVGDSTAASALRRVTGVTLVEDKFVYVRGLGERYSNAQLNGATVPSPDLTRNVLPLDIFPADIIESLRVTKGYAPELAAAFGGGNIDIRTKKVPESRVFNVTVASGTNSVSTGDGLTYPGGGDDAWGMDDGTRALPQIIADTIDLYRGSFSSRNMLKLAPPGSGISTTADARRENRALAAALNRNIDLETTSLPRDRSADLTAGYRWFVDDTVDFGVLAQAGYGDNWRIRERTNRRFVNPDTDFTETSRTVRNVSLTTSLNFGVRITDDHEIGTISLLLRNTDDDAESARTCVKGQFNDCFDDTSPSQGRIHTVRFEQRELLMHQIGGAHTFGTETRGLLGLDGVFWNRFDTVQFTWYHTDAVAETSIPNEVRISGTEVIDPSSRASGAHVVRSSGTAADFRFSHLRDNVISQGWDLSVPFLTKGLDLSLGFGYDYTRKSRDYKQTSLGLGSTVSAFSKISTGSPSEVFSEANILAPLYNMELLLGVGQFGTESYASGQIIDANYGKFDAVVGDRWRFSGGVRQEHFRQVSVSIDWLEYSGSRIKADTPDQAKAIADSFLISNDYYPSFNITYIKPDFIADELQARFGWSQTVARPDLREMSASTYIDPLTEARVRGNPNLKVSELVNLDARIEFFWDTGDNLTMSLFAKDIRSPIETVQGGATEDNILFNFVNAKNATVSGFEIEWMKSLGFLHNPLGYWAEQFYVSGNATFSGSEITIPPETGVGNITNQVRRMTQQSNWVSNVQIGYDSLNGRISGTLVYNAFGDRIFFAGIQGQPDGLEQPFHALDFVLSWHPADLITIRMRLKNLLSQAVEVKQSEISIIEQEIGTSAQFDFKYRL